jgi:hypothetical protein
MARTDNSCNKPWNKGGNKNFGGEPEHELRRRNVASIVLAEMTVPSLSIVSEGISLLACRALVLQVSYRRSENT